MTVTEASPGVPTRDTRNGLDLSRLWANRSILRLLVVRDLKVRYADSYLGYLWSVLEPLLMTLVYWVVFTKIFQRTSPEKPYMIFLLTGQLAWFWFNNSVTALLVAFKSEAALIRSTSLPRLIWIARVVMSKFVEYVFSLVVLVIFAVVYRKSINPGGLALYPVGLLLQFALLMGLGMMLAPLAILVKDLEKIVRILLRVMFYFSPVLYSVDDPKVPAAARNAFSFNPMAGILAFYREVFFHGELRAQFVAGAVVAALLALVVGALVFRRLEPNVLKEI